MSTVATIKAIKSALSMARMSTYDNAAIDDAASLNLYAWNAQISGAFIVPLHVCEVVLRNAVAGALEAVYGPKWPWSPVFEESLPTKGYNSRSHLTAARKNRNIASKVIPELNFAFWQDLFTKRHDGRIWNAHLHRILPNLRPGETVAEHREKIYADLDHIRRLRNRIAHHEPIFTRHLADDLARIDTLIELRCRATAFWLSQNQGVTALLAARPERLPT